MLIFKAIAPWFLKSWFLKKGTALFLCYLLELLSCVGSPRIEAVENISRPLDAQFEYSVHPRYGIVQLLQAEQREEQGRGLIFVALEETAQNLFDLSEIQAVFAEELDRKQQNPKPQIKRASDALRSIFVRFPEPRFDELIFHYSKYFFPTLYRLVLWIPPLQFEPDALTEAIFRMEQDQKITEYDLVILTHGNFSECEPGDLDGKIQCCNDFAESTLSAGEIRRLFTTAVPIQKLRLTYLQMCGGSAVAEAWHDVGSRWTLFHARSHFDFFFYPFFLESLREHPADVQRAYEKTVEVLVPQAERILEEKYKKYRHFLGEPISKKAAKEYFGEGLDLPGLLGGER